MIEQQPPTGYTLVLPPGWSKIPLRHNTEGAIKAIVDRATEGGSRDAMAIARRELTVRLRDQAAAAAKGGGLDLYLPTEEMYGFRLAASFVVAEVAFNSLEPLDPAMLVARLASEAGTTPSTLDGALASRAESVDKRDPDAGALGARQVSYSAAVPHDPDRWLLVTFSTAGLGDPEDELADLSVEMFDAIMLTFRWTRAASASG